MEIILVFLADKIHGPEATAIIIGAFIIALAQLFYKIFTIRLSIAKVYKEIFRILSKVTTINLTVYDELSQQMFSFEMFAHAWSEFDKTVIEDQNNNETHVYNTQPFSKIFRKDDLLEKSLDVEYFRKVPGILTSIGLFFTFLFIVFGLHNLHPNGNRIDGINELVVNLSAKFQSSVLAIFLSILFTIIEHRLVRGVEKQYQKTVDFLDSKFEFKTGEDYLRNIDQNILELSNTMKHFGTNLSGIIKQGMTDGMRPSTDRLLVVIENLEKQKSENIADALAKVMQEFKSSLGQSAGSEFAELGNTISKLANAMNDSAERSALVSARMDNLVKALDDQIGKQEKTSDITMNKVFEGFGKLLNTIEESSKNQNQVLNKLMEEVVSRTGTFTDGLISNVESLTTRNSKVVEGFSGLNENLSKNLDQYNKTIEASSALINSTGQVAASVNKSLSEIIALQTKLTATFDSLGSQTALILQIQKEGSQSMDQFRSVFREVENGLEPVLLRISENLVKYNDLTRTGLEGHLDKFDNTLSSATSKLSNTVRELDDALENIGEIFEKLKPSEK